MDTSTRLAFVLGDLKVGGDEIEPPEWLEILKKALKICKPYLKYLSGFEEIADSLNHHIHEYDRRATRLDIVEFPEGLNQHTRCFKLAQLSFETEGENRAGREFGTRYVTFHNLLLTQDGRWVRWYTKYERVVSHGLGYRQHRSGITETAVISEFTWLDDRGLLLLLEEFPKRVSMILKSFCNMLQQSVEEKQGRLRALETRRNQLAEMMERVTSY